jgi:hypothetical protein
MKTLAIFFSVVTAFSAVTNARATTFSLQPIADARILNISGYLNSNFGSDILSVYTSTSGLNTQRTLIQFNLSSITLATNEQIQTATFTLIAATAFGNNNTTQRMEIYRVLSPWTETGLTWSNRDASHTWTNAGGDFVGTNGQPYAVSTSSPTNGQPVTWDVTKLVEGWVTHAITNCGMELLSYDGNQLTFAQRESATPPLLTVVTGLSPLHTYPSGTQVVLWWTGSGVLQEKTNLSPGVAWSDSGRTVTQSGGTNSVTISTPTRNNFFRLRGL